MKPQKKESKFTDDDLKQLTELEKYNDEAMIGVSHTWIKGIIVRLKAEKEYIGCLPKVPPPYWGPTAVARLHETEKAWKEVINE